MPGNRRFMPAGLGIAALLFCVPLASVGAADPLAEVRQATVQYHDIEVAKAAGYGEFYLCTDNEALGAAMGQHYADVNRVLDPTIDALDPEVLVYQPKPNGGYRLVGVEYVVFAEDWDALHIDPPKLFGRTFDFTPAPNRYGLPDFYALHAWIWKGNPRGAFDPWNPTVSCRGNGDPA